MTKRWIIFLVVVMTAAAVGLLHPIRSDQSVLMMEERFKGTLLSFLPNISVVSSSQQHDVLTSSDNQTNASDSPRGQTMETSKLVYTENIFDIPSHVASAKAPDVSLLPSKAPKPALSISIGDPENTKSRTNLKPPKAQVQKPATNAVMTILPGRKLTIQMSVFDDIDPSWYALPQGKNNASVVAVERSSVVVVMLGTKPRYLPCFHNMLHSLRNQGHWEGDIVVMVPSTGFPEQYNYLKDYWGKKYKVIYRNGTFVQISNTSNISLREYTGGKVVWDKISMFTDPYYRKYEYQLWIDSDSQVNGKLYWFIERIMAHGGSFFAILRHHGDHSLEWDKLPTEVATELRRRRVRFDLSSQFFAIKNRDMKPPDVMLKEFHVLLRQAGHAMKYPEQSLLSLYFWNTVHLLPYRYFSSENCFDGFEICPKLTPRGQCLGGKLKLTRTCRFFVFHDIGKTCFNVTIPIASPSPLP